MINNKNIDPSVVQSMKDRNAHYDIDGVTYWDGHVVVADSQLSKEISTKDVTGEEEKRLERYPPTTPIRVKE